MKTTLTKKDLKNAIFDIELLLKTLELEPQKFSGVIKLLTKSKEALQIQRTLINSRDEYNETEKINLHISEGIGFN